MKKLFMFIAAVLALVSCSSVTSNKEDIMVQEDRKVGKFTSIAIQGSPTVIYRQGNTCTVKVRANKSVIKDIKTTIDKGCLNVSMKGNGGFFVFSKEKPITIYVTSPDLIGVEIAGSGDFKSEMPLDTDNIRLVVRGSGDIDFDGKILCDNAKMEVTGSGDIDVKDIEDDTGTEGKVFAIAFQLILMMIACAHEEPAVVGVFESESPVDFVKLLLLSARSIIERLE